MQVNGLCLHTASTHIPLLYTRCCTNSLSFECCAPRGVKERCYDRSQSRGFVPVKNAIAIVDSISKAVRTIWDIGALSDAGRASVSILKEWGAADAMTLVAAVVDGMRRPSYKG